MQTTDVLYRTDFFPGLGWMLTKNLWIELKPKWPLKYVHNIILNRLLFSTHYRYRIFPCITSLLCYPPPPPPPPLLTLLGSGMTG